MQADKSSAHTQTHAHKRTHPRIEHAGMRQCKLHSLPTLQSHLTALFSLLLLPHRRLKLGVLTCPTVGCIYISNSCMRWTPHTLLPRSQHVCVWQQPRAHFDCCARSQNDRVALSRRPRHLEPTPIMLILFIMAFQFATTKLPIFTWPGSSA